MSPHRRWNLADFDVVLDHPALPPTAFRQLLPRRRPSEIQALRAAVHVQHSGSPDALPAARQVVLTDPLCAHLTRRRGTLICAWCGAPC
jgi:hypothetical protein